VVVSGGRVLVGLRRRAPFQGCSEFPGGKLLEGEAPAAGVEREVLEETGVAVAAGRLLLRTSFRAAGTRVDLRFFLCAPAAAHPLPRPPFRWVAVANLGGLRFPPANGPLLRLLEEELRPRT
jgi:8-oxo-dGTP diphosphatase